MNWRDMRFLVFLLAILGMVNMHAKVVLPSLFTDNMVLQQVIREWRLG